VNDRVVFELRQLLELALAHGTRKRTLVRVDQLEDKNKFDSDFFDAKPY
jgi:hypothetical protein